MEKGKWEKGQTKYWAMDGNVYDVNPETGIYKDNDKKPHKAGSWVEDSERHMEVEVKGEYMKTKQVDDNGRVYESSVIHVSGKNKK